MQQLLTQIDFQSAIVGFLVIVGSVAITVLKFKGLITFGKPVERRDCSKLCPEHPELMSGVAETKIEVESLKERQVYVRDKVDKIEIDLTDVRVGVAKLVGFHERNGMR